MKKVNIAVLVDTDSQDDAQHVANLLAAHLNNYATNPRVLRAEVETPVDHTPEPLRDDTVAPAQDE